MHHRIALTSLLFAALLGACATGSPSSQAPAEASEARAGWPPSVGRVALETAAAHEQGQRLDVGLVIFDPGIPEDPATHSALGIFPKIRRAEARFMPVVLRQVMVDSDAWGVVRVLPEPDLTAELLVHGRILHSDGRLLALHIEAVDASGRQWLDRVYVDEAAEGDYPVAADGEPYLDLYHSVANDLLAMQRSLGAEKLEAVRQVALLRYASSLSPEAIAGYLAPDETGGYALQRLPAAGDPMLQRVDRIRNQEHLFIDTVDEQYAELQQTMAPTYHLWRQYDREQAIYREEYQRRVANRDSQGRRGSFFAMQRTYDAYKWSKIHEQDLDEMAGGFINEVQPTVMEASGKVFRLSGSLESQYAAWRGILREIFTLETGLPPVVE